MYKKLWASAGFELRVWVHRSSLHLLLLNIPRLDTLSQVLLFMITTLERYESATDSAAAQNLNYLWTKSTLNSPDRIETCRAWNETREQCDQIWRVFAILPKSYKSLTIFWGYILYLAKFWTYFGKFGMLLDKFTFDENGQILKNNLDNWSHCFGNVFKTNARSLFLFSKQSLHGQWLWLSWRSGCFQNQRSVVRIH